MIQAQHSSSVPPLASSQSLAYLVLVVPWLDLGLCSGHDKLGIRNRFLNVLGRRNKNRNGHENGNGDGHQQAPPAPEDYVLEHVAHAEFRAAIMMLAQALTAQVNQQAMAHVP
ncbi:hypothetical protein HAX54_005421 [Datura stramonium]|uniref:Uncharacterized protein n=1 Tax=Datura stramonium TaxID=4076 RepID=A0ABS8RU28_DATST|nr:hypothetical protein [Datura stramonium]